MKKHLALLLAVLMLFTLAACGGSPAVGTPDTTNAADTPKPTDAPVSEPADGGYEFPEMTLALGHAQPATNPINTSAKTFAEKVGELTGGKVVVNVYPAGELGEQAAMLDSCYSGGDVDIVITTQADAALYMPKLNAVAAPFLFENYDHAHRVIDNYVYDWINSDSAEQMNVHVLSIFDYGFRHVTTNGITVTTAADLKDVKIRVPGSAGLLAAFDALGANTQTIAYAELYQALKQGVVDAEENPVATILSDSYYECQDNLALTGHYFDMTYLCINNDLWESLNPELQEVFTEAAQAAQSVNREIYSGNEESTIAELEKLGMTVTEVDKQSFIDMMGPAYEKMAELCSQAEMDALLEAVEANR